MRIQTEFMQSQLNAFGDQAKSLSEALPEQLRLRVRIENLEVW